MTYAGERVIHDADSHIMELPDWLASYADRETAERLRPLHLGGAGRLAAQAVEQARRRREAGEVGAAAVAVAEEELLTRKGWHGLGAFDPAERSRALDLLGFASQLVFSTFAPTQYLGDDPDLVVGGTRAHNRAMADFCRDDPRLIAVGAVPWLDPPTTLRLATEALDEGCGAILVPSHPGRGISPTHPDHDGLWSMLEERGVPFLLHIGGGGRMLKPAFHDNGRPVTDFLGGGENIRSKDYMVIHQMPEQFLSAMVLDGVLDAHPGLRGGCIEQGAMWIVPWMRRLDIAQGTFRRTEPALGELSERASDYVRRQLFFTPFPTEDVSWITSQVGPDVCMFSSDYPHPEGTKDPIGRFEATLGDLDEADRDKFYRGNFARMMGWE